jgi:uncharacterized membrane protein
MRFFLWPFLLFAGLFKVLLLVAVVVLFVRLVSHRHAGGYWHGRGYWAPEAQDPRRIAAMRYAAGRIDRAEFDRILSALDASEQGTHTPPPAPPA